MNLSNNEEVVLPSGAKLEMTLAPFSESEDLFSCFADCLKKVNVDMNADAEDLGTHLNSLKEVFLNCLTSKELKSSLLRCLKRCSYNKRRITDWEIFEDVEARQDYLSVCWEVSRFNLAPFTKNLFSKFNQLLQTQKQSQGSK